MEMYPDVRYNESLKNAGIAGIFALIFGLLLITGISIAAQIAAATSHNFLIGLFTVFQLAYVTCKALFTYGFAVLGKKYQNRYLEILSYLSIVVGVILGLIIVASFYSQAIDKTLLDWVLNRILDSIIGLGIAVALLTLYSRFGLIVLAYTTISILLSLLGLFGAPANWFAILVQVILYGLGVMLLFRAAKD